MAQRDEVTVETDIDASPERLYDLVSDVTAMGRWSPETTGCRWIGGASGAAVGSRFRGSNRDGWRRWSTTCRVVTAEPGREFAFDVSLGPWPISSWVYRFDAVGGGSRVTETWRDKRPALLVRLSPTVMGVPDRPEHNRRGMEKTLENLKGFAEQ